jgi:predicted nucleic-acid-binding Zn-ribbon protein
MKKGQCPKCGSKQVFRKMASGYRGNMILGFIRWTSLTDYVCVDCGYIESYVCANSGLEHIKNNWQKV